MRNQIFLTLISLLALTSAHSQDSENCGSDFVFQREHSTDPVFERRMFNLEQRLVANPSQNFHRDETVLTVPTVVHIIHIGENPGEGTNISDEQIQSAIVSLNEDFRKIAGTNGDGDGVDVGIEFCLALRDPDGNSTNGIVRVDGTSVPLYETEGISVGQDAGADELTVKELSMWPKEEYLNIWVVNEIENNDGDSGIQGFAYFPTSNPVDGVTILHNAFGTVGNLKPYTDLNRTTTHEVGHYLGLYHTFHNSNDCAETNCETQGDRVCDTPITVLNSNCNDPECSGNQQVENYMDYTGQSCKNMFSEGQKVRMRYTLTEERASVLESFGCVPASDYDAGITAINSPLGSLCNASVFPEVVLTNFGGINLTSINIEYYIDNGSPQTFNWTGNLSPGSSESVSLPLIQAGSDNQTFYANTTSPNGNADSYSVNDGSFESFTVSSGASAIVNVTLDYFGSETTWEIIQDGNVMSTGGPYNDNSSGTVMTHDVCLAAGCYDFIIYDEIGDGLGFLSGNFEVIDPEGNQVVYGANNFGSEDTQNFCITEPEGDAPTSNFSASDDLICAGSNVDFTDSSTGEPTSWLWEFEGGSPSTSSDQNPQNITYTSPGNYNVTLTTSNNFGADAQTNTNFIEVQESPGIFLSSSDVTCFGENNGTASVDADNATISWSNGASGSDISGLSPGNYTATATASAGCSSELSFTISEPTELSLTIFKSDLTCYNTDDGAASASVSGGTAPYDYDWSSGPSLADITGLDQGAYSLTVTDANGCTVTDDFVIIEPSEISTTSEVLTPETCVGSDGSASANGMGGTGNLSYEWSDGTLGQMLTGVPFGTYEVYVTDNSGCTSTSEVTIPYDCEGVLPTTQLISANCNKGTYAMNDILRCNEIEGAQMYLWHFSTDSGELIDEAYTLGNNNTFLISNLPQVSYGQKFDVKIQVQIDDEWGDWGGTCSVNMMETPPGISLLEEDCNAETLTVGTSIQAETNTGAEEYEWLFTFGDNSLNYFTYITTFTITEEMNLPADTPISVYLRARYGDAWSEFGSPCSFQMDYESSTYDIVNTEPTIKLYPNPNEGREFSLEIDNLFGQVDVIEIKIFTSGGKLIKRFRTRKNENTHISETYSFDNKLSTGMYLVQVDFAGHKYQQKLIVK